MDELPLNEFIAPPSPKRISRDEMNLAEFPLTVLSTRNALPGKGKEIKTLEFSDQVRGKNGEVVNRSWIITGADKFGLPTSSDDEVLLGLLKLTVDGGFTDRKVYFSRYELLKILKWSTEGRSYQRLQKALDRLSGVRIKATNAFYDNESKSHSTRNFGLIDAYEINDGRDLGPKPSYFIWSEALFKSYKVGFIKKFDLEFYLDLKSAVSKRLFRYLDKHFWYRSRIQVNIFTLAHEKIGISRNYIYASSLRQQLDPAIEELSTSGFLSKYEFIGKGRDTEVVLYAGSGKPRVLGGASPMKCDKVIHVSNSKAMDDEAIDLQTAFSSQTAHTSQTANPYEAVIQALCQRGIREPQARRLILERPFEALSRIRLIVEHFDSLTSSNSKLVSKNPVGFLYRAVENYREFLLPSDRRYQAFSERRSSGAADGLGSSAQSPRPQVPLAFIDSRVRTGAARSSGPKQCSTVNTEESDYLISRKLNIKRLTETLEPEVLKKMEKEVDQALSKLKGLISEQRFKEVIEHGVEEKVAKLFAVPGFEEWLSLKRKLN